MTEERLIEMYRQKITEVMPAYQREDTINLMKQACNEAIDHFKEELKNHSSNYVIILGEVQINEIADKLKVK